MGVSLFFCERGHKHVVGIQSFAYDLFTERDED